eukprot:TRINITY_DN24645_c0_g1_i1.p1 TRINITY_DN24645_c0_g1~~TRINITY_DN24645_c0_g1_i1.p1  ORF type:complete len:109 (+),score=0.48 TRINITY_DN24645_c0_g1_i1:64-390(+)
MCIRDSCSPCNTKCDSCYGASDTQCSVCASNNYLMGSTYLTSGLCKACHANCEICTGPDQVEDGVMTLVLRESSTISQVTSVFNRLPTILSKRILSTKCYEQILLRLQ